MTSITQRLMDQKYDLHEDDDGEDSNDDDDNQHGDAVERRERTSSQKGHTHLMRALMGELLGVCIYVFIGCMATPHPKGVDPGLIQPGVGAVPIALSQGLGMVFLTMGLLKISGAHLNPAVTLAVALCGEMGPGAALAYVATQIVGGIVGAALCRAVLPTKVYIGIHGGAHVLHVSAGSGVACEALLTCVVVITYILCVVDHKTRSERGPIAIGFAVVVCTLAGAPSTGGSMNPVRSFGPAVAFSVYDKEVWQYHYIYWGGAVFGALAAVFFYRLVFACPEKLFSRRKSKNYDFKNVKLAPVEEQPKPIPMN